MNAAPDTLDIAVGYAQRGWPVHPLKPGEKTPATEHGYKDATTDVGQIVDWWDANPQFNIGIPTGLVFDVLDIDGHDALEALDRATPNPMMPGDDPIVGPMVATPRGWHVYFRPTGRRNKVQVGGMAGVDWRGEGGYVVAAGSVREDGERWRWNAPHVPSLAPDAELHDPPTWLLQLLDGPMRPAVTKVSRVCPGAVPLREVGNDRRYAQGALEHACERLAGAVNGTRNDILNRETYALTKFIRVGRLSADEVGEALLRVAMMIGLPEAEAVATIRSGLTAGLAS